MHFQTQSTFCENTGSGARISQVGGVNLGQEDIPAEDPDEKWENQAPNKKKRPGLTPGLIPSKKAKKFFKKTNNSSLR